MATLLALPAPAAAAPRAGRSRTRRWVLGIALALSIALHLAVSLWPVDSPDLAEPTVLNATITEMPPPPTPAAATAAAKASKPRPKRTSPLVPPLAAGTAAVPDTPNVAPTVDFPAEALAPLAEIPPALAETAEPVALASPPSIKALPARVELAYRVTYGLGLYIGDASYRFEHANGRYRISTVGEARGLAALVLRGQGKVEARGLITPAGLQPWELAVERGSRDRREVATFDWESGIVSLAEDKTAALELPTFDPLSLMWQFYFSPPAGDEQTFTLATTRRVFRIHVKREGTDTVEWPYGQVAAERWHRTSEDGRTESVVWLAPSLRYLPIKMRVTNTLRGTVEIVLAAIRVDDEGRVE
ncbi:MAG: DUF3108 domain-containing protein [Betaproteobacteria bacterium]